MKSMNSEVYLVPFQTSMIETFAKLMKPEKMLIISAESAFIVILQGPNGVSDFLIQRCIYTTTYYSFIGTNITS